MCVWVDILTSLILLTPGRNLVGNGSSFSTIHLVGSELKLAIFLSSVDLPPEHLRRVKALKNKQKSTTQIEANFYKEVQQLEAKYHKLYQPFYDQRKSIVTGKYEPTDAESHWSDDDTETGKLH